MGLSLLALVTSILTWGLSLAKSEDLPCIAKINLHRCTSNGYLYSHLCWVHLGFLVSRFINLLLSNVLFKSLVRWAHLFRKRLKLCQRQNRPMDWVFLPKWLILSDIKYSASECHQNLSFKISTKFQNFNHTSSSKHLNT